MTNENVGVTHENATVTHETRSVTNQAKRGNIDTHHLGDQVGYPGGPPLEFPRHALSDLAGIPEEVHC